MALGCRFAAEQRHGVHADERVGGAKDEVALRVPHVEAIRPQGRRASVQFERGVPQRHGPAGPDTGRDRNPATRSGRLPKLRGPTGRRM